MLASDLVQTAVATVEPGFILREAARRMAERSVGALVIVDPESHPVGIITDRDLVVLLAEGTDPDAATIGCFAGQMLQTVGITEGVRDVTEKMHKHGIRRLPVVDEAGRLAGIIALDDILVLLGREMADLAETVRNEFSHERAISALRGNPSE